MARRQCERGIPGSVGVDSAESRTAATPSMCSPGPAEQTASEEWNREAVASRAESKLNRQVGLKKAIQGLTSQIQKSSSFCLSVHLSSPSPSPSPSLFLSLSISLSIYNISLSLLESSLSITPLRSSPFPFQSLPQRPLLTAKTECMTFTLKAGEMRS
jgi:hypothetical protein